MTEALRLGTHLKVKRTGYTHHGIYVGNGNVVHYSGFAEMFKKGKIELTSIDDFMGDAGDLYRVKYPTHCEVYSDDEICERALSRLSENNYNLVTNNCEHFATWCVTGVERSEQVENIKKMTTTIIVSANVIRAMHMLYVSTAISAPIVVAGGAALPTIAGGSTISGTGVAAKVALTGLGTTAVTGATIATTTATGTAAGGTAAFIGSSVAGAAVGGATAAGVVAATAGGATATTAAIGAAGLVGGVVAAPILAPIAAGAAIGAGAVALWSWLKD